MQCTLLAWPQATQKKKKKYVEVNCNFISSICNAQQSERRIQQLQQQQKISNANYEKSPTDQTTTLFPLCET